MNIKNKIYSILRNIYVLLQKDYIFKSNGSEFKMIVSYITEPFKKKNDPGYINKHQNRQETLIIAEILSELNITSHFTRLDKPHISLKGYNIVFGVEPNFINACKDNPNAIKIYYATGAYIKHQNNVIQKRTDEFNAKNGTNVPYYRLVKPHNSSEISDFIIQIGSKFTIETYPDKLKEKIITIRQSCHTFKFDKFIDRKLKSFSRKDFIWMGSTGSILKGLDLILDYFLLHPELNIHIFGPIDPEVWQFYKQKIESAPNIYTYGFVDLDSKQLETIALVSSFVIMPSASEGGCPGAVINMMKLGCIPIVTSYAAFDEINDYGILINGYTVNDLSNAIDTALSITDNEIKGKIKQNFEFANSNYNTSTFKQDFKSCMKAILKIQ